MFGFMTFWKLYTLLYTPLILSSNDVRANWKYFFLDRHYITYFEIYPIETITIPFKERVIRFIYKDNIHLLFYSISNMLSTNFPHKLIPNIDFIKSMTATLCRMLNKDLPSFLIILVYWLFPLRCCNVWKSWL